jgi:heptosyltransferase-2
MNAQGRQITVDDTLADPPMKLLNSAKWRRLLIPTKYRRIGDAVLITPVLKQLRRNLPGTHISLLSGPSTAAVLEGCPYFDEVLTFCPLKRQEEIKPNIELIRMIRQKRFDATILLSYDLHPALMTALAGVPIRIGYPTDYRRLLLTHAVPKPPPGLHWTELQLSLLRLIGFQAESSRPEVWITDNERRGALRLLEAHSVKKGNPIVILQPGARSPARRWDPRGFAEVGDFFSGERSATVLLVGDSSERSTSEEVSRLMIHAPVVLTGLTSMREVMALISLADLFVGNDTGLMHLAVCIDIPCVGVFLTTDKGVWGYDTPRHQTVCLSPEIQVGDVIRTALEVAGDLAQHRHPG